MQANNTQLLSDDRLKFDEVDITGATATVMKLKPQIYRKYETINSDGTRPGGSGVLEIGLIAQDVESAAASSLGSNLVGETTRSTGLGQDAKTESIKTLSYERMAVVLWQCCRSLCARVEALEATAAPR